MKTPQLKILPIVCILLIALGGCSKEERQESKITGKWNTTSLTRNGKEGMKVWESNSFTLNCQQGGYVTCLDKWYLNSFTWEINEDGTVKKAYSQEIIEADETESKKQCIPKSKPQRTDNITTDYTWELSSDGKTLTLKSGFGEYPYEVLELSKKTLHLRDPDFAGDVQEFKMERQ